jgi:hypothetical protein
MATAPEFAEQSANFHSYRDTNRLQSASAGLSLSTLYRAKSNRPKASA